MMKRIYKPKKNLEEIVLSLLNIVNALSQKDTDGWFFKIQLEELIDEMNKWNKPI